MSFLDSLKKDFQHFFATRGAIKEHQTGFFNNLNNPVKLGLFFCIERKDELNQVRSLVSQIKKQNKNVTALVFSKGYDSIDLITDKSITLFNLNDFSLFGKMNPGLREMFEKLRFELLVSFIHQYDLFYLKLLSEIKAEFKIGPYLEGCESFYDLTILYKPDLFGFAGFYENIEHYLHVMKISRQGTERPAHA